MKTRVLFACLSAFSVSSFGPIPVIAQNSAKQTGPRSVEVKKVFGYYDMYLRLPPQERDGFTMVYRLRGRQGGATPQMTYAMNMTRIPVQIGPDGRVLNLPDQAMFQNGKIEIAGGQPGGSINMDLEPVIPLARTITVAAARNPIDDYAAALRRTGPLALMAPKLSAIVFKGGTNGEALFADGRRLALPTQAGGVKFQPSAPNMRGVVSLSFATPPSVAEFAQ
jgi:hypothetical protein